MSGSEKYYAIKKDKKYMEHYENRRANWCILLRNAYMFSDETMATNFANLTHGKVVTVYMLEVVEEK